MSYDRKTLDVERGGSQHFPFPQLNVKCLALQFISSVTTKPLSKARGAFLQ